MAFFNSILMTYPLNQTRMHGELDLLVVILYRPYEKYDIVFAW